MWYHIRAKDMSIFKPDGKVITFSLWAESEHKLYKMLTEKGYKNATILKSTNEEWTPEWANSESDVEEKEMWELNIDVEEKEIKKPEENPFW